MIDTTSDPSRRTVLTMGAFLPLVAGCMTWPEPTRYHVRYTLIARLPDGTRRASSVLAIATQGPGSGFMTSTAPSAEIVGEAPRLDLRDGRTLLAPLIGTGQSDVSLAFVDNIDGGFGHPNEDSYVPPLGARRIVEDMPVLIFGKVDDPTTAQWLEPHNIASKLGASAKLAFEFEATRAPVTFGKLNRIYWIVSPANTVDYVDIPENAGNRSSLLRPENFQLKIFDADMRGRTELMR